MAGIRRRRGGLGSATCFLSLVLSAWGGARAADPGTLDAGRILAWGYNGYNLVTGAPTANHFVQVAAGPLSALGLSKDGTLTVWGYDDDGQVSQAPGGAGYRQASLGQQYGLALTADGSIAAWGDNLLLGPINDRPLDAGYKQVVAAFGWGLALAADGSIAAWGNDYAGAVSDRPTGTGYTQLAVLQGTNVALAADGSIAAWGSNDHGLVSGKPAETGFTQVTVGIFNALALTADGHIEGWGDDGYGLVSGRPTGAGFTQVVSGPYHCLALAADGSLAAWGYDNNGQVSNTPTDGVYWDISAHSSYSLALRAEEQFQDLLVTGDGRKARLDRSVTASGDATIETAMTVANNATLTVGGTTTLAVGSVLPAEGWALQTRHLTVATDSVLRPNLHVSDSLTVKSGVDLGLAGTGFVALPCATRIEGGSVTSPGGVLVASTLRGHGDVRGPVSLSNGSTVTVEGGDLVMGDASASNGFASQGVLEVGADLTVTLLDHNRASLGMGSLTRLAAGSTLAAANGLDIGQGATLEGSGLVDTPNDLFHQLVNHGSIEGLSLDHPIYLAGYVSGLGTMDNVVILGTDTLAYGPTQQIVGNKAWASTALLIMTLGGTAAGSGHDQVVAGGELRLGGTLEIQFTAGFLPEDNDMFQLFDGALTGQFSTLVLPQLGGGLSWDVSRLHTEGRLDVVPEPTSIGLLGLGLAALLRRRRSASRA